MMKVFLVEDEFLIREAIKNKIDWNANGYEFCGEAGDGEMAWPMIQELKPDIVISDIKMPFMDGLSLSRLIKENMPETEVMILTGYGEFDYAREAIHIGVTQYLLKPISSEDLLTELAKVSEKITIRRNRMALKEKMMKGNL